MKKSCIIAYIVTAIVIVSGICCFIIVGIGEIEADSREFVISPFELFVEEYKEKHFQIEVLHRECRNGFKAGALQAVLNNTEEEFVTIFDADRDCLANVHACPT